MPSSVEQLVEKIHASPTRVVLAVSGGGSRAVSALLEVSGASRTVLEAIVPYCQQAMVHWLGGRPDSFCSAATARAMAVVAMLKAQDYDSSGFPLAGIGLAASLASDRPKRGPHRLHVAIQTADATTTWSLELQKGRRSRLEEEQLAARLVLNATAEACGVLERLDVELTVGEQIESSETVAPAAWQDLLLGRTQAIRQGGASEQSDSDASKVLFPGAFNPIHAGHRGMAEVAGQLLGHTVAWELSILNPDKPPLDYTEIARRTEQFAAEETIWLTRAATFEEKSGLFPGATFVVGADTIGRIAAPRYYGNDAAACGRALERMAERGCRFLVFGRETGSGFKGLADLDLPPVLRALCQEVPGKAFREDVSSTELRCSGKW